MSDKDTPEDTESITATTQSTSASQYRSTAVLGGLVFLVLPAAYYFGGVQAAGLVTILTLFLIVYDNRSGE
ncbi:MAG: hypothetical protein J07HN4v3_01440 [Halonotius sp. J07HN4]|nr:MAG: hypothetical protein J07HN4v3_01440 [Halonotius sp. J07HN4]